MHHVHGLPRRDVVALGADEEDRRADVAQRQRATVVAVAAGRQVVVQVQLAQVLGVHPVRQARRVDVPRGEVGVLRRLGHQVLAHQPRPQQVVRVEQRERARHLLAVEVALFPRHVFEVHELAVVDEDRQFARLGEVDLGRQQRQRSDALVAGARHRRREHREEGAAEAVADRVHLLPAADRRDRVDRRADAEPQVVVDAEFAVARVRVAPRQHEHRVALLDEMPHHRVARRQVEDVVLQDRRRDDQHRLRVHVLRRRRVLDQLDQVVAQHHLARRHRDFVARPEARAVGRRLAGEVRQRVAPPVVRALRQVHAARFHRARDDFRIGRQEVGRAQHVEHLARGERDHPLVMAADAGDVVGRVPDPLLHQQEALVDQVERRLLPRRIDEAPVLRQRVDARLGLAAASLRARRARTWPPCAAPCSRVPSACRARTRDASTSRPRR